MASAKLPDGSRLEVIAPPLTEWPMITIERPHTGNWNFEQLERKGMLAPNMALVLTACVRGKVNIIVSGDELLGKTDILNALCQSFFDQQLWERERIVSIEDDDELRPTSEQMIVMRPSELNWKGEREISKRALVQKALRMKAHRVIVGDVDGPEAYDIIRAMTTGAQGSMITIRANEPYDCLQRLEGLMQMGHANLSPGYARHLIGQARPLIVQVRRLEDGTRRITEIAEVAGLNDGRHFARRMLANDYHQSTRDGDYFLTTLFHLEREGRDKRGFFKCKFVASGRPPQFWAQLDQEGVPFKIDWLKNEAEPAKV